MVFGNKNIYAIEVYHQPQDNGYFYMCGRMCVYLYNKAFGDINDELCHLFGVYDTLRSKIENLTELKHDFDLNNDFEIFNFLDDKLYIDMNRTLDEMRFDSKLYKKFDFFTNMGEMFDRTKSFIYMDKNKKIHILFQIHKYNKNTKTFEDDEIICNELDKRIFEDVTNDFIKWYEKTEEK
jgi:hypothetical protein